MLKKEKENKKKDGKRSDTDYAHNPRYCMILPDAADPDEENISSTSES